MAQTEDTELRDLVIDALDKNGSLAKIRALLRANIFLAFEDERENIKQNANLDNIFKMPEGVLSLSIVHEFLEFCSLKNTLFVYMSESRQGKEYNYEGKKALFDKINIIKHDLKEPILITLLKTLHKYQNLPEASGDAAKYGEKQSEGNFKDEQNCTYIVHEDSQSSTTNSNSDNSSDEKNKLQPRLQLDNSDTDTSSDSARDRFGSEYVPNDFIASKNEKLPEYSNELGRSIKEQNMEHIDQKQNKPELILESKITTSSSDSTSYVDIKSLTASRKLLNTSNNSNNTDEKQIQKTISQKSGVNEYDKSPTLSNVSSISQNNVEVINSKASINKSNSASSKSNLESAEYSYDFSSSPKKLKDTPEKYTEPKNSLEDTSPRKLTVQENDNHSPYSSRSSISISDVADLISDRSSSSHRNKNGGRVSNNRSNSTYKNTDNISRILSGNSGELTESPIPSLSNLSLDIHSDLDDSK